MMFEVKTREGRRPAFELFKGMGIRKIFFSSWVYRCHLEIINSFFKKVKSAKVSSIFTSLVIESVPDCVQTDWAGHS